jgi:hypothetical protein
LDEGGCLYEPVFFALFGVCRRPCVFVTASSFDEQGMTWEFMGSNGNLWMKTGISCVSAGSKTGFCGIDDMIAPTARDHSAVIP